MREGYFNRRIIHKIRYPEKIIRECPPEEKRGKGKGRRQYKLINGKKKTMEIRVGNEFGYKERKRWKKEEENRVCLNSSIWTILSVRTPYTQHPKSQHPVPMLQWIPQTQLHSTLSTVKLSTSPVICICLPLHPISLSTLQQDHQPSDDVHCVCDLWEICSVSKQ